MAVLVLRLVFYHHLYQMEDEVKNNESGCLATKKRPKTGGSTRHQRSDVCKNTEDACPPRNPPELVGKVSVDCDHAEWGDED